MGVKGMWEHLNAVKEERLLQEYALSELPPAVGSQQFLRLGYDASVWMCSCARAFRSGAANRGLRPDVQALFDKLARVFRAPVAPLFVFDGEECPAIKRGHNIKGPPHYLTNDLQDLLDCFGFPWYTAPGEAEAELAYLNKKGHIQAVVSEDVDCFLFGAKVVIRSSQIDRENIVVYRASTISSHEEVGLSQGDMILIALLRGGDYDESGLRNCGMVTAVRMTKYGFGDGLLHAATQSVLEGYVQGLRPRLRTALQEDPLGLLGQRNPTAASAVGSGFPDLEVVRAYANPLTSWSNDGPGPVIPQQGRINLTKLAALCTSSFSWASKLGVLKKFERMVWEGVALRLIIEPSGELLVGNPNTNGHCLLSASISRIRSRKVTAGPLGTQAMLTTYRAKLDTRTVAAATLAGITTDRRGSRSSSSSAVPAGPPKASDSCLVTILGPILEAWNPALVADFQQRRARASKPRGRRMGVASLMAPGTSLTDDEDLGYRSDDTVTREIERAFEMYDLHGAFGLAM
ncbi:PIN domain-like protein [Athelia psychrophila]|uniref:PIN domain-like protein n=1 Tax=Athelia psychrophila TaxID=1759441 RepID=A0A166VKI1_9AGAM|nr:PIN domain-like protein [Fibularhizoctonia sp. CBS 109695]